MTRAVYQRETSSFDRALGFFDAIYGFAVTLLVVNIALAVIAQAILLQVAARRGLLIEPLSRQQLRARAFDALVAPAVFIASIPVAYLTDGNTAKFCWLA